MSSVITKLPQLVSTVAVAGSPFSSTCSGSLNLSFFAGGASTSWQSPLAVVVVGAVELDSSSPHAATRKAAARTASAAATRARGGIIGGRLMVGIMAR